MQLHASRDLIVDVEPDGSVRVGWGEADWFGPGACVPGSGLAGRVGSPAPGPLEGGEDDLGGFNSITVLAGDVTCSVRAYADRPMVVFRTEATADVTGLATGAYDQPSVGWPVFTPADRAADGGAPPT